MGYDDYFEFTIGIEVVGYISINRGGGMLDESCFVKCNVQYIFTGLQGMLRFRRNFLCNIPCWCVCQCVRILFGFLAFIILSCSSWS